MPARKGKGGVKKLAKQAIERSCRWDSDGEPSSLDVLTLWLETPGNYARWQSEKGAACQEILSMLKTTGIMHRSETSINAKIRSIEKRWEDANEWLKSSGLFVAYQIGGVDDDIRASVNKLCPAYDRVAPVFRNASSDEIIAIENNCSEKCSTSIEDDERCHRQELFECELEAKRFQADVDIVCARVLGRHKLLNGGVPPDEVDRVLPSS